MGEEERYITWDDAGENTPPGDASLKQARRIVVKIGSNVLSCRGGLNRELIQDISRQICALIRQRKEVVLVSSGAMAAGLKRLAIASRPDALPERQAISAVGQAGLIRAYEKAFAVHGKQVAQLLLTSDGLQQRRRYLNVRNTLSTLMAWGVVPVINENDTVSVEEIRFGDNDNLSAMISLLLDADLLVNLTDIDGLYDKDPRVHPDARFIRRADPVHRDMERYAGDIPGELGTGGMLTKIKAARKVNAAGIPMIIARGTDADILLRIFENGPPGTFFVPRRRKMANRKSWIAFSTRPEGTLSVDDGAENALRKRGKSLLPSGIIGIDGEFETGAPVRVENSRGDCIAVGLVNYDAEDIGRIMGLQTDRIQDYLGEKPYDEVIHRNNLALRPPRVTD